MVKLSVAKGSWKERQIWESPSLSWGHHLMFDDLIKLTLHQAFEKKKGLYDKTVFLQWPQTKPPYSTTIRSDVWITLWWLRNEHHGNMLQRCSGLWQWQLSIKERTGLGDCGVGGDMIVIRRETKSAETQKTKHWAFISPLQHHLHLISAQMMFTKLYIC